MSADLLATAVRYQTCAVQEFQGGIVVGSLVSGRQLVLKILEALRGVEVASNCLHPCGTARGDTGSVMPKAKPGTF